MIKLEDVTLRLYKKSHRRFFLPFRKSETFCVLKDISFQVDSGETVGIIGNNGAGKTTLSRLMTGAYLPNEGKVTASGKVFLLAPGLGFNNELSGRDNIFLSAAYMGVSEKTIKSKYKDIVEFSDLADRIDESIKVFSVGMKARLGFSIAVSIESEIIVIDEVISAGDIQFKAKFKQKTIEIVNSNKTVIIISHQLRFIEEFCNRVIWLDKGHIVDYGPTKQVIKAYRDSSKK